MAIVAVPERQSDTLLGRHPARPENGAVRQRLHACLFESLAIPGRGNKRRIQRAQMQMIGFVKDPPTCLNPVTLGLQCFRFEQRLRSYVLQHLPVAVRLSAWEVDWIRPQILDSQRVIVFGRDVRRPDVQPGDRRRPICKSCLIPGDRCFGFSELRPGTGCRQSPTEQNNDGRQQGF